MSHVVIGFAEAISAPEVLFSLLSAGHEVSALARNAATPLRRLPLRSVFVLPSPEIDAQETAKAIGEAFEDGPDYFLPLDDQALWLGHHALGASGALVATGREGIELAFDKCRQIEVATQVGLDVPPTVFWAGNDGLTGPVPGFPAIAKPAMALGVQDRRLIKSDAYFLERESDLPEVLERIGQDRTTMIFQPLLRGQGEGIFGFAGKDGVTAWSAHRRIRMMNPHGSGSSACVSIRPDEKLLPKIEAFLSSVAWKGPFMMEFLRGEDGTAWFMELNGRMWGSMALARRQGLEYPAWAVAQAADGDFVPSASKIGGSEGVSVRHLGRDILHLAFVLKGPKSAFHKADWPNLGSSALQVLRPGPGNGFYNYDPAYPRYFLRDALSSVKDRVRR